ncbi:hypothetical protein J6590_075471 [Homalodisca vitripennis]|nr:hypothetical protein J6590_075471 [Homalodisca vitripennis]
MSPFYVLNGQTTRQSLLLRSKQKTYLMGGSSRPIWKRFGDRMCDSSGFLRFTRKQGSDEISIELKQVELRNETEYASDIALGPMGHPQHAAYCLSLTETHIGNNSTREENSLKQNDWKSTITARTSPDFTYFRRRYPTPMFEFFVHWRCQTSRIPRPVKLYYQKEKDHQIALREHNGYI